MHYTFFHMFIKILLPTYITFLRILAVPIIIWCVSHHFFMAALCLYLGAMATDYLDGFLARKLQQESRFGQLLDPIADKVLIISLLYYLCCSLLKTAAWMRGMGSFFIAKELVLLLGAAWLYVRYEHFFKPTKLSRVVSVGEMIIVALLLALLVYPGHRGMVIVLMMLAYVTQLLALWLLVGYVKKIYLFLRSRR